MIDLCLKKEFPIYLTNSFLRKKVIAVINKLFQLKPELKCNVRLSIIFASNKRIRQLNKIYRGVDANTDVLAFEINEKEIVRGVEYKNIGDMIISVEQVRDNAEQYSKTFKSEICLMLIHGVLHLFGFEHEDISKSEAKKMMEIQAKLLIK